MADTPLIDANPTHYLTRVDRDTPPYQFVRELVQNGIEANAKRIEIKTFDYEYEDENEDIQIAPKFMIVDDGEGMTPSFMFNHLAKMNSSSKASNSDFHENFGIGAKITTAIWNPYGVVFASWSKEDPENGHLVWLHQSTLNGKKQICLRSFYVYDEEEDLDYPITTNVDGPQNIIPLKSEDGFHYNWGGIDWESLKPSKGHGTVVILLGSQPSSNTWTTSEGKPFTGRSLRYYLNVRYANLPEDLELMVLKNGSLNRLYGFNKTLDSLEDNFVQSREYVNCPDGFKVEVLITQKNSVWYEEYKRKRNLNDSNSSKLNDSIEIEAIEKGFVAVQYETEKTSEFYNVKKGFRSARQWGIGSDSVIPLVKIIVHPPKSDYETKTNGVYPNEGRYLLQWKDFNTHTDTNTLNLLKVQEYFKQNMPPNLSKLIEDSFANYKSKSVNLDQILNKYKDIFNPKKKKKEAVVEDPSGKLKFDPQSQNNPSNKKDKNDSSNSSSRRNRSGEKNPNGSHSGVVKRPRVRKKIEFYWHNFDKDSDTNTHTGFLLDGEVYPFDVIQDSVIRVQGNKDHTIFREMIDFFERKKPTIPRNVIEEEVLEHYEKHITAYINHVREKVKGSGFNEYVSQKVLYAKCLGIFEVWEKINFDIGRAKTFGK
jgi:hypothetical protein